MENRIDRKNGVIYTANPAEVQNVLKNMDRETWEQVCEYRKFLDGLAYEKCLAELEKIKRNE